LYWQEPTPRVMVHEVVAGTPPRNPLAALNVPPVTAAPAGLPKASVAVKVTPDAMLAYVVPEMTADVVT
jgi:hypothetical protein